MSDKTSAMIIGGNRNLHISNKLKEREDYLEKF